MALGGRTGSRQNCVVHSDVGERLVSIRFTFQAPERCVYTCRYIDTLRIFLFRSNSPDTV